MSSQETINFEIAGVVFSVTTAKESYRIKLPESYNSFLTTSQPEYFISVNCQQIPRVSFRDEQRVFDSGGSWCLFRSENQHHIIVGDSELGSQPDRIAVIEDDSKRVQIYCAPQGIDEDEVFNPLEYPLDQILMICLLSLGRGLIVHACGIDDDGKGYLFAGNSTDGKSSLARLWQNHARILNDDRVVLCRNGGRFLMFGTPWHGDYSSVSPGGVPLEKIFFLHQAKANETQKGMGVKAVSSLLTRSFPPLWDPNGMGLSAEFCASLVESVPCHDLNFTLDEEIVEFIRCVS
jgi:hypothetical protein